MNTKQYDRTFQGSGQDQEITRVLVLAENVSTFNDRKITINLPLNVYNFLPINSH
jgi:hypothetical protein